MTMPWHERIGQRTNANRGYGPKGGGRELYGTPLDKSQAATNERRRLYAEAREDGLSPWGACEAAGWDPGSHHARERWYQAMKSGLIVQGEDGKWQAPGITPKDTSG